MLPERFSTNLTSLNSEDRLAIVINMVTPGQARRTSTARWWTRPSWHTTASARGSSARVPQPRRCPAGWTSSCGHRIAHRRSTRCASASAPVRDNRSGTCSSATRCTRCGRGTEPRQGAHRQPDDRRQRRDRAVPGRARVSVRRVVNRRSWDRIRTLAEQLGRELPPARASNRAAGVSRPAQAGGAGTSGISRPASSFSSAAASMVNPPGAEPPGRFGLAVRDYSHSTAPNRRFPDLVTQRLLKAALASHPAPYSSASSSRSRRSARSRKTPRTKSSGRSASRRRPWSRIGQVFDAFVTGASNKGTFVRVTAPPIEGKLLGSHAGLDVGDRLRRSTTAGSSISGRRSNEPRCQYHRARVHQLTTETRLSTDCADDADWNTLLRPPHTLQRRAYTRSMTQRSAGSRPATRRSRDRPLHRTASNQYTSS